MTKTVLKVVTEQKKVFDKKQKLKAICNNKNII